MINNFYEAIWALIGAVGTTAKYFNDILLGKRTFKLKECLMNLFSGGFIAWLCAKSTVVVAGLSVDIAFIVAGISGVLGFGASVSILDKVMNGLFARKND